MCMDGQRINFLVSKMICCVNECDIIYCFGIGKLFSCMIMLEWLGGIETLVVDGSHVYSHESGKSIKY